MLQFELRKFADEGQAREEKEFIRSSSDAAAKSYAGRLARKINGPIDIARAGSAEWEDRYLTTAHPADPNIWRAGYRFERLD